MKLSPTQRNELSDLLIAAGLPPEKFDWEQMAGGFSLETTRMRLKRAGKPQYFEINQDGLHSELGYNCRYVPGVKEPIAENDNIPWAMVVIHFKKWCSLLEKDKTGTDNWGEIAGQLGKVRILTQPTDDQPITSAELTDIQNRMAALKEKIQDLPLSELYQQLISITLDRVAEHAKHLNKFDWKSLFTGTIANLVSTLQMPPQTAGALWEDARASFDNYITVADK